MLQSGPRREINNVLPHPLHRSTRRQVEELQDDNEQKKRTKNDKDLPRRSFPHCRLHAKTSSQPRRRTWAVAMDTIHVVQ